MQNTDKALSDFNAWWDRQPFRDQFEDMKQQMANVWVASRAEMVIALPDPSRAIDIAYFHADVLDAIAAAGLTVKE